MTNEFRSKLLAALSEAKIENYGNTEFAMALPKDDIHGFSCNIPQLKTHRILQSNGFYLETNCDKPDCNKDVIICSTKEAKQKYQDIISKFELKSPSKKTQMSILNEEFYEDGIFIYIPDNAEVNLPLQMLDVIKSDDAIFINAKNIVLLGNNSRLKLIHCDDSVNNNISISNNNLNVFLGRNSSMEYYKMENINNHSSIFTETNFTLSEGAELTTYWLSLNGGNIKNSLNVFFEGENARAELNGLYLVDKEQVVDNQISVYHNKPNCYSNQLYKGILDDVAKAYFNGHVFVGVNSAQTVAMQNNKNILLTDKASVNTNPFLEIYNDDVKCSHGATIGQLDDNAMFYLRSRGISERSAKMLLMYAFCNDVLVKSSIEELKERLGDIIKRRLHGELTTCDSCVLHCSTPDLAFEIDMTKI